MLDKSYVSILRNSVTWKLDVIRVLLDIDNRLKQIEDGESSDNTSTEDSNS